jgi:hypothetical protein
MFAVNSSPYHKIIMEIQSIDSQPVHDKHYLVGSKWSYVKDYENSLYEFAELWRMMDHTAQLYVVAQCLYNTQQAVGKNMDEFRKDAVNLATICDIAVYRFIGIAVNGEYSDVFTYFADNDICPPVEVLKWDNNKIRIGLTPLIRSMSDTWLQYSTSYISLKMHDTYTSLYYTGKLNLQTNVSPAVGVPLIEEMMSRNLQPLDPLIGYLLRKRPEQMFYLYGLFVIINTLRKTCHDYYKLDLENICTGEYNCKNPSPKLSAIIAIISSMHRTCKILPVLYNYQLSDLTENILRNVCRFNIEFAGDMKDLANSIFRDIITLPDIDWDAHNAIFGMASIKDQLAFELTQRHISICN